MEAVSTSETSDFYQTTWCNIPEDILILANGNMSRLLVHATGWQLNMHCMALHADRCKHHAMKTSEGVDVSLQAFLTSALQVSIHSI
jgi:hypothetical protein